MRMRKQEMSPCRVPCHLGQMCPVHVLVVGAGIVVVGAGTEIFGAVVLSAERPPEPELYEEYTSQVWSWQKGPNNCRDKVD